MNKNSENFCSLCSLGISRSSFTDGTLHFCCPGCQAVFQILATQGISENFQNHSIFQGAVKAGLISNPALIEQIKSNQVNAPEAEWQKFHLEIGDMWCPSCAEVIKLILQQQRGIRNVVVDYSTDLASIEFSPRHIAKEKIYSLIADLGYIPKNLEEYQEKQTITSSLNLRFIIAAFCTLNVMMFSYPIYASYFDNEMLGYAHLFSWISLFASIPVVTYCAWPIIKRFFNSLAVGFFGMEALVVIGVTAAIVVSLYELFLGSDKVYFDSMTVIITFILLGKIIESKAKFSIRESLTRLTRALPKRGRKRFEDQTEKFVLLKEINLGDILVAFHGEKIVLDGVVVDGEGACDESVMTGEAWPQHKKNGSSLLAGSILQQGRIIYKVTRLYEETALHKIIDMIEKERGKKALYTRSADLIVRWFVPIVIAIAAIVAITSSGETALIRSLSVLLISCPCALGIAAPLAEAALLNSLANRGVIVRNRGCLALLGKETSFVFDKTGTVTEGNFSVTNDLTLPKSDLQLLRSLASQSTHPAAKAIAQSITESTLPLENITEYAGKGLEGYYKNERLTLGSKSFLESQQIKIDEKFSDTQVSTVFFAKNKLLLTQINLSDTIRQDVVELISSLKARNTILLSGDSPQAVNTVATACQFKTWQAHCTPLQKQEYIKKLRADGEIVCMVGDGINDAPALNEANIGISVVNATEISIQVSDLLLTTNNFKIINEIGKLACKARKIIRQNLFWAFAYNIIGIGLAAIGLLSPIFAAAAMVLSSLIVILNAQRLS